LTTALLLTSALSAAVAAAQGRSGAAPGHAEPPSSSGLASGAAGIGATPLAWVDDASVLMPGAMSLSLAASHWSGDGISEIDVPSIGAAVGLADRVQLAASLPFVVGDAGAGIVGGVGTSYFSVKYAAVDNRRTGIRIAVAPTLELLGSGVLASLGPRDTRAQIGLPASIEIDRPGTRLYGSTGWFSRGVWFAGGGVSLPVGGQAALSVSFSRSWTTADAITGQGRDRAEVSGGVGIGITRSITAFASASTTVATQPENGAGTTLSAGVSVYVKPAGAVLRHP